jgi:hypothetical protein
MVSRQLPGMFICKDNSASTNKSYSGKKPHIATRGRSGLLRGISCRGAVVVSVLATGPKVCGFEPGESVGFLRAIKIRSTTFSRTAVSSHHNHQSTFYLQSAKSYLQAVRINEPGTGMNVDFKI